MDEIVWVSFNLTRSPEFEFNPENAAALKLLRDSFVVHCSPTRLDELVYPVARREDDIDNLYNELSSGYVLF